MIWNKDLFIVVIGHYEELLHLFDISSMEQLTCYKCIWLFIINQKIICLSNLKVFIPVLINCYLMNAISSKITH